MKKLVFNLAGLAILAILLLLNALEAIDLGSGIWLVAIFALVAAFSVIGSRYAQSSTNGR